MKTPIKQIFPPLFVIAFLLQFNNTVAQCVPDSTFFNYTGGAQTFTVPSCITEITVRAWGAAGGGGGADCDDGAIGGGGAYTSSIISVTTGEVLTIIVGGGGEPGANHVAGTGGGTGGYGYGNGGTGGNPGYEHPGGSSGAGAGGGGGTAVLNGITPLLVAGGGGGGGGAGCSSAGGGGGGGAQNGFPGTGAGGTAGGSSNNNGVIGSSGTWDEGGGGGGGGGWNGGDSGEVAEPSTCDCGGGGGGGGNCLGSIIINGSGSTPGYSSYPELPAGDAVGGPADAGTGGQNGGNGFLIIEYCMSAGYSTTMSYTGTTCYGSSDGTATASITGGTSPFTYSWTPSGQTNQTATGLSAGTYTVTVADAGGCTASAPVTITQPAAVHTTVSSIPPDSACAGQSVVLNASGANSYQWSTGATTSSITVIVPAGDTAYYGVQGNIGGCSDSIPVKIKIIPEITASISAVNDTVCPHGATAITATPGGGQATYKWSNGATTSTIHVNDTVTTTYSVMVYGLCDSVPETKTVTVIPLAKPIISGSTWKCKGVKDTLTVSSSTNPTTYVWSNGSTATSIITGTINADSAIYVTAENSLGCPVTDTFHIAVRQYPAATFKYPPECGNTPDTITAKAIGTGPFTYQWSTGGTYDTIIVTVPDTTTFTVVVSNGCPVTKTVTVIPYFPALSACCNNTIIIGRDTTISASGANIVSYQWSPAAGLNCDTCANVIASPTVTTTYTVTGRDAAGCPAESFVTIAVETPCFNFTVPNVFTPTNAGILGLDNKFYINTSYSSLNAWSILIYDRWGKEVFKSTNPDTYWTGNTESGGAAPAGIYYYVIDATCQGTAYKKDGFVQLIR